MIRCLSLYRYAGVFSTVQEVFSRALFGLLWDNAEYYYTIVTNPLLKIHAGAYRLQVFDCRLSCFIFSNIFSFTLTKRRNMVDLNLTSFFIVMLFQRAYFSHYVL